MIINMKLISVIFLLSFLLMSCTTSPPRQVSNICSIFDEKSSWYKVAKKSERGSPIPVMMAIMNQESSFVSKARPPRTKILWVIPGPRKSSAYGYLIGMILLMLSTLLVGTISKQIKRIM